MAAPILCAIGDIHGEVERLRALHGSLLDHRALRWPEHSLTIVHLGDFVDRGPNSCGVIEHIRAMETNSDCAVVNLMGNHERMMLDALTTDRPDAMSFWLSNGGEQTLESYDSHAHGGVPDAHIDWLAALPNLHVDEAEKLIFVHAGIDPIAYPDCLEQVRLWTRSPRFYRADAWANPALDGWRVVHGHTPTEDSYPDVEGEHGRRINIDTGAVYGGRLTAAVFAPGADVEFLYA